MLEIRNVFLNGLIEMEPPFVSCSSFVVDIVEERVGLGGSQFSESILERLYSAHASQQNVVILEFGSPCSRSFSIVLLMT